MSKIYAHRGANLEAAENTRSAFERSLRYPIDGIETDIQLSLDEVAVLWHDDDLSRLGLAQRRIAEFTLAQLQALNFAAHFSDSAREPVMRLSEFVMTYHARAALLLEIKKYPGEPDARQQLKVRQTLLTAALARDATVTVSSFDLDSLIYAHRLDAQARLVFNLEPEHDARFAAQTLENHPWLTGLCVAISTLNDEMAGAAQKNGKLLAVYTCNCPEEIERALRLKVDILISDVPQQALAQRALHESAR